MSQQPTDVPGTANAANAAVRGPWWREAVIYQVYPRSFADGNGDGMGDLPGITTRLPYLRDLGVDAVWLSPFYASPQADAGYDVADYRTVDPMFGRLSDAEDLVRAAHALGLRVIVDLVPNHCSDQHEWFKQALRGGPGSPLRERFHFRPGRGVHGELPPNDWESIFGGPAWTRTSEPDGRPGEWYLHLFAPEQPDFDWTHPAVHDEFRSVLRFWLDLGTDGFRIDVAHGLVKAEGLPDVGYTGQVSLLGTAAMPYFDQDGVHEIYREWRRILDEYSPGYAAGSAPGALPETAPDALPGVLPHTAPDALPGAAPHALPSALPHALPGERIAVAEAWTPTIERAARYLRPDELHQAFNFEYLTTPWDAAALREVIDRSLAAMGAVGAPATWVLSNHDVTRHATRFGNPPGAGTQLREAGDRELGLRRARAASLLMLALPGSAYLYQGEELGLPDVTDLPDEVRQDPSFFRASGQDGFRDGCRVPIPWSGAEPPYGFGPVSGGPSWLPQPKTWAELSVEAQTGDPDSTLELYRAALALRRAHPSLGAGTELTWLDTPTGVLAFHRGAGGGAAPRANGAAATDRLDRTDGTDRADGADRPNRANQLDQTEQADRAEQAEQANQLDRTEQADRAEQAEQANQLDRTEQADRARAGSRTGLGGGPSPDHEARRYGQGFACTVNLTAVPVTLAAPGRQLLSSGAAAEPVPGGTGAAGGQVVIAPDTTVWWAV